MVCFKLGYLRTMLLNNTPQSRILMFNCEIAKKALYVLYPHAFEHVGASLQTTLSVLFAVVHHFIAALGDNVLCILTRSISTRKP